MQKHVNLVDLVKSFPTNIYLQNLASIQKRTSPVKFAHLAEKSEKGSISNLSTKVGAVERGLELRELLQDRCGGRQGRKHRQAERTHGPTARVGNAKESLRCASLELEPRLA